MDVSFVFPNLIVNFTCIKKYFVSYLKDELMHITEGVGCFFFSCIRVSV